MGFTLAFTDRLAERPDLLAVELQGPSCPCVVSLSSPANGRSVTRVERGVSLDQPGSRSIKKPGTHPDTTTQRRRGLVPAGLETALPSARP